MRKNFMKFSTIIIMRCELQWSRVITFSRGVGSVMVKTFLMFSQFHDSHHFVLEPSTMATQTTRSSRTDITINHSHDHGTDNNSAPVRLMTSRPPYCLINHTLSQKGEDTGHQSRGHNYFSLDFNKKNDFLSQLVEKQKKSRQNNDITGNLYFSY